MYVRSASISLSVSLFYLSGTHREMRRPSSRNSICCYRRCHLASCTISKSESRQFPIKIFLRRRVTFNETRETSFERWLCMGASFYIVYYNAVHYHKKTLDKVMLLKNWCEYGTLFPVRLLWLILKRMIRSFA